MYREAIILEGASLFNKGKYQEDIALVERGGVFYRVARRVKAYNAWAKRNGLANACERKRRQFLIGELAEEAVAQIAVRAGFTIDYTSWKEFRLSAHEGVVDIAMLHNGRKLNVQVKGSIVGNRSVQKRVMPRYLDGSVDLLIFVAVRLLPDCDERDPRYHCFINEVVKPSVVVDSWRETPTTFVHPKNREFMTWWKHQIDEPAAVK